jgi:hemerythrin-like metal-binding protein
MEGVVAMLEWSKGLELGVDKMDATHREFVDQLNALAVVPDGEFLALLDEFIAHTVEHFEQEKRWMTQMPFPPLHCHTAEHDGVLEAMRETRKYVQDGRVDVGRVLARELGPWFASHAATMDAMLAHALKASGIDPEQTPVSRAESANA